MKNLDPGKFQVGQNLCYRVGKIDLPVTFLSYGPRMGKTAGKDTILHNPQTAIVRDANGNFITVRLDDLRSAS